METSYYFLFYKNRKVLLINKHFSINYDEKNNMQIENYLLT